MKNREHQEQVALFNWLALAANQTPELALTFAIPNGGDRHPAVAAKLKAEGVRAGVPDIFVPIAVHPYHGLFLELKAEGGRTASNQREWINSLRDLGYRAEVVFGWLEAREVILEYLAGINVRVLGSGTGQQRANTRKAMRNLTRGGEHDGAETCD